MKKSTKKNNRIIGKFKHEQLYSLDFQTGFIYEHKTYLISLKIVVLFGLSLSKPFDFYSFSLAFSFRGTLCSVYLRHTLMDCQFVCYNIENSYFSVLLIFTFSSMLKLSTVIELYFRLWLRLRQPKNLGERWRLRWRMSESG